MVKTYDRTCVTGAGWGGQTCVTGAGWGGTILLWVKMVVTRVREDTSHSPTMTTSLLHCPHLDQPDMYISSSAKIKVELIREGFQKKKKS